MSQAKYTLILLSGFLDALYIKCYIRSLISSIGTVTFFPVRRGERVGTLTMIYLFLLFNVVSMPLCMHIYPFSLPINNI